MSHYTFLIESLSNENKTDKLLKKYPDPKKLSTDLKKCSEKINDNKKKNEINKMADQLNSVKNTSQYKDVVDKFTTGSSFLDFVLEILIRFGIVLAISLILYAIRKM